MYDFSSIFSPAKEEAKEIMDVTIKMYNDKTHTTAIILLFLIFMPTFHYFAYIFQYITSGTMCTLFLHNKL